MIWLRGMIAWAGAAACLALAAPSYAAPCRRSYRVHFG
jgi:hypothetical protein